MKIPRAFVAVVLSLTSPHQSNAWYKFESDLQISKIPEPFPISGQTVYVRIDSEKEATVQSVSRLMMCDDIESLGFAIIAPTEVTAFQCLQSANPKLRAGGLELTNFVPVSPQPKIDVSVPGGHVHWFKVVLSDEQRLKLKTEGVYSLGLEYRQELLGGHFYTVAEVAEDAKAKAAFDSSLAYQLIARSPRMMLRVPDKDADYERLGDIVVVYLRFGKLVHIDASIAKKS